jgi:flagellar biosynthesis/type III secretory pathway M-ring protein FliF/YscJ|tara:strand:- start:363 stop:488 length:126 start_codon:yes stop_codon:yes gene_type:complete
MEEPKMDKLNELKDWIMDLDNKKKIAIAAVVVIIVIAIVAS